MGVVAKQGPPGPSTQPWVTTPGTLPSVSGQFTVKSKVNDVFITPTLGCASVNIQTNVTGSTGSAFLQVEVSSDGVNWSVGFNYSQGNPGSNQSPSFSTAGVSVATGTGTVQYMVPCAGVQFVRVRLTVIVSAGSVSVIMTPAPFPGVYPVYLQGSFPTINTGIANLANTVWNQAAQTLQSAQTCAVVNGTTTRASTTNLGIYKTFDFLLNITSTGTATGTLQIFLEDSANAGTTWDDVVSFNTFALGSAVTNQRAMVNGYLATTRTQFAACAIETLTAGTARQGPMGDLLRVREVISGVSGSPVGCSYTITFCSKP